jgi:hypothetical protein
MRNEQDQQAHQVAQQALNGVVDPLSAGVGRDLGRNSREQTSQRFGAVRA